MQTSENYDNFGLIDDTKKITQKTIEIQRYERQKLNEKLAMLFLKKNEMTKEKKTKSGVTKRKQMTESLLNKLGYSLNDKHYKHERNKNEQFSLATFFNHLRLYNVRFFSYSHLIQNID